MTEYLGDGVYADWDGAYIILTTQDGISVTNEICLEVDILKALIRFYERVSCDE